jgi:hypothetical protein
MKCEYLENQTYVRQDIVQRIWNKILRVVNIKKQREKKNLNVDKEANSMDTELQIRKGWGERN